MKTLLLGIRQEQLQQLRQATQMVGALAGRDTTGNYNTFLGNNTCFEVTFRFKEYRYWCFFRQPRRPRHPHIQQQHRAVRWQW
jgi:hypothetical protein